MGVTGLWKILEQAGVGHPIKLEGLEGKRIAVDANVWLYKFIRGFRDKDQGINLDAHKVGLFLRICKLLYYRIKPLFVFDGPAPILKRKTLEKRKDVRHKMLSKAHEGTKKLLLEKLKALCPAASIDDKNFELPDLQSDLLLAEEQFAEREFYGNTETATVSKRSSSGSDEDEESDNDDDDDYPLQKQVKIDINSEEFASFPSEIKYEILQERKEVTKRVRSQILPEDANTFSNFQLKRMLDRRQIQEKIEQCEKDIQSSCRDAEIEGGIKGQVIHAYRVQSNANQRMVYLKNSNYQSNLGSNFYKSQPSFYRQEPTKLVPPPNSSSIEGANNQLKQFLQQKATLDKIRQENKPSQLLKSKLAGKSIDAENTFVILSDSDDDDEIETIKEVKKAKNTEEVTKAKNIKEVEDINESEKDEVEEVTDIEEPSYDDNDKEEEEKEKEEEKIEESHKGKELIGEVDLEEDIEDNKPKNLNDAKKVEIDKTIVIDDDDSETEFCENIKNSPIKEQQQSEKQATMQNNDEKTYVEPTKQSEDNINNPPTTTSKTVDTGAEVFLQDKVREVNSSPPPNYNDVNRKVRSVTDKIVEDCKSLLVLFGIPYIVAPGEAEAQCAALERLGLTEGTITDDSDIWLFGAQNVYRNFFSTDKYVMQYKMNDIEFHARLSRENLICFAMLVGSDYTDGVNGIGAVHAIEILSEFRGDGIEPLEKFKTWMHEHKKEKRIHPGSRKREKFLRFELPQQFPSQLVFNGYMQPVADLSSEQFTWAKPKAENLRDYGRREIGWSDKQIDEKLNPVLKKLEEKRLQPVIDSYFLKVQANPDADRFKSKRVNEALSKISSSQEKVECDNEKVDEKIKEKKSKEKVKAVKDKDKSKEVKKRRGKKKAKVSAKKADQSCIILDDDDDDDNVGK